MEPDATQLLAALIEQSKAQAEAQTRLTDQLVRALEAQQAQLQALQSLITLLLTREQPYRNQPAYPIPYPYPSSPVYPGPIYPGELPDGSRPVWSSAPATQTQPPMPAWPAPQLVVEGQDQPTA